MENSDHKTAGTEEKTRVYSFAQKLFRLLSHTIFPVKYHHPERLAEMEAPFILMSNHRMLLDPFFIALPCKKYEIRFLGKKEICNNKLVAWFVTKLHMITVDRGNQDMNALRQCFKVLKEGHVLGIFPEGTRHLPDLMAKVENGTSVIALRANVPMLPVYTSRAFAPFRKTHVYYGEPVSVADIREKGFDTTLIEETSERIKNTFLQMRADVESGKYQD